MSIEYDVGLCVGFRVDRRQMRRLFCVEDADGEPSWSCEKLGVGPTDEELCFMEALGQKLRARVHLEMSSYFEGRDAAVFEPLGLTRRSDEREDFPVTVTGSIPLKKVWQAAERGRFAELRERMLKLGLRPGEAVVTATFSVT